MSGRLEEIPGEEAFPAYLESVIAGFYERGGRVALKDGAIGSITIGGTVSPAGGNFDEPVTQGTLKVVGAFHGLSRARSDARRYPAIDPLESWSKYGGVVDADAVATARKILSQGNDVSQMMKVIGEEGTSLEDFIVHLKSEYMDATYLQQDAFDPVDSATSQERQSYVFDVMVRILETRLNFTDKEKARQFFHRLTQATKEWNRIAMDAGEFKQQQARIEALLAEVSTHA